jgi:hypothetical protein
VLLPVFDAGAHDIRLPGNAAVKLYLRVRVEEVELTLSDCSGEYLSKAIPGGARLPARRSTRRC